MDRVSVDEFEGMTRTVLYALRIAVAEVALEYLPESRVIRNVAERAGILAHLAADTFAVIDDYRVVFIAGDGLYRADLHAGRFLALQAHHRNGNSRLLILEHMHIGILRIEFPVMTE